MNKEDKQLISIMFSINPDKCFATILKRIDLALKYIRDFSSNGEFKGNTDYLANILRGLDNPELLERK